MALIRLSLEDLDSNRVFFEHAVDLVAEAQSALRVAVARMNVRRDFDQNQAFSWLRMVTAEQQILVQRFMRVDDPADPSRSAELDARINALDDQIQQARDRASQQRKVFGKVRYLVKQITAEQATPSQERWPDLAHKISKLLDLGVPPSNREVRELLLPLIDQIPDMTNPPQGFQLVLREIDQFLATRPPTVDRVAPCPLTAEATVATRLLQGKVMILIGGQLRPDAKASLENSFGLRELIWITTREHESLEAFEPYIARPEVAVVLLAIRWSSHSYGAVSQYCTRYGKPLVRLPGGYNPNQVAAQICAQCSDRLQASLN